MLFVPNSAKAPKTKNLKCPTMQLVSRFPVRHTFDEGSLCNTSLRWICICTGPEDAGAHFDTSDVFVCADVKS